MKALTVFLTLALGAKLAAASAPAALPLKILYIGEPATARARQFEGFLRQNFAAAETVSRRDFLPARAARFDVVLLDWPQPADQDRMTGHSPLGERARWTKPTILLGSAGLNLAVVWKLRGGSG